MEKFILEHKKISFFIGAAVAFYFFVAVPLEKIYENRKNIELKQKRLERIISTEKIITEDIKKLIAEKEKQKECYEEKKRNEKRYKSLGEFQKELNDKLLKNNIKIYEIGRSIFNEDRCLVPYTIYGAEENIINFLLETDKNENISIFKGPFEFYKEDNKIKLRFSIEIKIEKTSENLKTAERKTSVTDIGEGDIKILKYKMLGENRGIFYIVNKKGIEQRYYLKKGEKFKFNESYWKADILKNKIILHNLENGKRAVFYLGDEGEKSIKKN